MQSHPDGELTFIVGADMARTLPTLARTAGAGRAGAPGGGRARGRAAARDVLRALARCEAEVRVPGDADGRDLLLAGARAGTRRRADRGLVEPAVARYIAEHGLYRARRRAETSAQARGRGGDE